MSRLLEPLAFPLHGRRLIEASAGTGKTFTLAALYLRLILGHGDEATAYGRPLLPPEILVVTFTKAATEELRGRIRDRLEAASRVFRGRAEPGDPVLTALLADYPDESDRQACARRLDIAAQLMDEAAIHTIHAWCQRVLREYAFDAASPFEVELTDETALRETVVRDYWRSHFYPLPPALAEAVTGIWSGPEALEADLRPLIEGEHRLDPPPPARHAASPGEHAREVIESVSEAQRSAVAPIKAAWQEAETIRTRLLDALAAKRLDGRKLKKPTLNKWIDTLAAWAESDSVDKPDIGQGLKRLTPEGLAEAARDGESPPAHPAFERLAELPAVLESLPRLRPPLLADATAWVRQRLAGEKRERARWAFSDLLTRLDEALADPDRGEHLAQRLRVAYPVALIDEFQDTDPVQYRIFQRVYARTGDDEPGTGLFLIGDPKQAIYAFRGADIFTYLRARRDTEARYTLGRNFRSAAPMVEAVNHTFASAAAAAGGPFALADIPFEPVATNGRDERFVTGDTEPTALTFRHLSGDAPLTKTAYRAAMAASCAEDIARLLDDPDTGFAHPDKPFRRVAARDIAVLVPGWQEAAAVRSELARRNVKSVYLSLRESVYQSPEALDLGFWLQAVAAPEDDAGVRAALATATLGLSWPELERLRTNEHAWEATVERFQGYRRLWRRQGVLPMLERLMGDYKVPQHLLAGADGERRLTNVLHLGELLQQASAALEGEQALMRYLADARDEGRATADEQIMRLESDESLVRVITVHKSKGLEFPVVYLPFACRHHGGRGERAHSWHDPDTGEAIVSLDGAAEAQQRAAHERLAEDLRLLYVGITRAAHLCRVGVTALADGKRAVLHETAVGHLLGVTEDAAEPDDLQQRLTALAGGSRGTVSVTTPPDPAPATWFEPPREEAAPRPAAQFTGHIDRRWWIGSYTALLAGAEAPDIAPHPAPGEDVEVVADPTPVPGDTARSDLHAFPRGPRPGTFLHGLLEWAAGIGFDRLAAEPDRLAVAVAEGCRRRQLDAWAESLTAGLRAVLEAPLLPGLSLARLGREHIQAELEFLIATREATIAEVDARVQAALWPGQPRPQLRPNRLHGMLTGYIDLVFEHDGRYYLADYKSNYLGDGPAAYTQTAMAEAMLEHRYDLQYVLYTLALHRLLRARLPGYDYDAHLGGVFYLFLRAMPDGGGVFHTQPPRGLIEGLDAMLRGEAADA
ncbi:exodeoxyribonuclease V subunit beta [Arhodomonas sp. AD133]|uniref:exodeoxyribonuclease V subunit beta n=1 Tax=Arhodomonas sp. AD133 TaxID=3415009 RepID=UPI003EBA9487